jgi:hypothetical protein
MIQRLIAIALVLTLAACDDFGQTASRYDGPYPTIAMRSLNVVVPDTLKVSEENRYYPFADIVWRGEPFGDRRQQIRALFEAGAAQAGSFQGPPANVSIEVMRFHGVTEKTRLSIGGTYALTFRLTVTDPRSGAELVPSRVVVANLKAPGGDAAIANDRMGLTEKVHVTRHLAATLRRELGQPAT